MSNDDVLNWLLRGDNPPVRLLTLTRLLHKPETDIEVQETRSRLMDYSVTQGILAHIDEIWQQSKPWMFWNYKGKHWNTVYLGLFMADGRDPRIAPGIEAFLEQRWDRSEKWQCMTACMLRAFHQLGYGAHPHVVAGVESLAQQVLDNGGVSCVGMGISLMTRCYMTLPKLLLCFTEVPTEQRSAMVNAAIDWIVAEMVSKQAYIYLPANEKAWDEVRPRSRKRADYPEGETPESWREKKRVRFIEEHGMGELLPKRSWTRLGFPTNYNSNVMEAMLALVNAGVPMSPELAAPLQVIRDKRTADGFWLLKRTFNGQMWADVEVKGQPSKWLTLFALIVLEHFE